LTTEPVWSIAQTVTGTTLLLDEIEVVSNPLIASKVKARAAEIAQHTWEYVSILRKSATQRLGVRWGFETVYSQLRYMYRHIRGMLSKMEAFMAKPHIFDAFNQMCDPEERNRFPEKASRTGCRLPMAFKHPGACHFPIRRRPLLPTKVFQTICALLSFMGILSVSFPAAWAASLQNVTINSIDVFADTEKPGNQVRAYVTVTGQNGRSVTELSIQQFTAIEDGQTKEIDAVTQTTDPMAIVLAKDGSGITAIEAARQAAIDFVSMLSSEDQIAVFTFDRETTRLVDFTRDHEAVIQRVAGIRATPKASTRLYDTILEAVKKAAEIPKGRRAIIVLTDGKDEQANGLPRSVHQFSDVIDEATTQTIRMPIYTIGVGPRVDAAELGRMARLTGGRRLLASSVSDLKKMYQIIAEQLKNQFRIKYASRAPSGEHSLVIKVRQNDRAVQDEKRFWSPPLPAQLTPDVQIVTPQTDARLKGIVPVQLELSPADQIAKIRYYVDGQLKNEIRTPPFDRFEWHTEGLASGLHVLRVEAVTAAGQLGVAEITVSSAATEVAITEPASGQSIQGDVTVKVRINSDAALSKVSLFINSRLHKERIGPPYDRFRVNTADLTPGRHTLMVSVEDVHGQVGSADLAITIPQPAASGLETIRGLVLVGVIAIVAAGAALYGMVWLRRRKAAAGLQAPGKAMPGVRPSSSPPLVGDEDETVFFPDIGSATRVPLATLTAITSPGVDSGYVFDIQGESKIGRHAKNDIVIADKSVSRRHAEIYFDDNTYYLRDLGSRYGTIVNRRRISLDASSLFDGAQIQLGPRTLLEFHLKPVDLDYATLNLESGNESDPGEEADPDDNTVQIGS